MNPRDVGPLFMIGFEGTGFSPLIRNLVDEINPAGVILFSRNIESPTQVALLSNDLQRHALKSAAKGLFIGVDQEGGRVNRFKKPLRVFPSALDVAQSGKPEHAAWEFASVTAIELRLVGVNLNFVPVLDVLGIDYEPSTTVIGDRSFGCDPAKVTKLGKIVVQTMREGGVIPCCKHFPGHGGTSVDSHVHLPVDSRPFSLIEASDLAPFRMAVEIEAEMIMAAHVLYPDLDRSSPASLSQEILGGLLRNKMQFKGIVATDDLDMGAVADLYNPGELALGAFMAGADLMLFCRFPDKAVSARDAIYDALRAGSVPEQRIKQSLDRINTLKRRYASSLRPCDVSDVRNYFHSPRPTALS